MLLLLLLLLERFLDDAPVFDRIGHAGRALERVVVGGQRVLVLARLGQCVATVVGAIGAAEPRVFVGRLRVVALTVGGAATPGRIGRDVRRALGITLRERGRRLLVTALPQVGQARGLCRWCRQVQREHEQHEPAAAEADRRQRQQRQQQPWPAIAPAITLRRGVAGSILGGGDVRLLGQHGIKIAAIGGERRILATAGGGEFAQRRLVDAREHDVAAVILEETAIGQGDRRARIAADSKHRQRVALPTRTPGRRQRIGPGRVGEQHDLALVLTGLLDECGGAVDRLAGGIALHRHRRGIERLDQMAHGGDIVGERGDDEGGAGIGDQRRLVVAAAREHVVELEARALEAAGFDVLRQHRRRQFEREHPRGLVAQQRHRLAFPRRTGQGQTGDEPTQSGQHTWQARDPAVTALDQVRQQLRIDRVAPATGIAAAASQQQPQQRHGGEREQRPWPQEMKIGDESAHASTALRQAPPASGAPNANAAHSRAAANGNQYSSSTGRRLCVASAAGSSVSISR